MKLILNVVHIVTCLSLVFVVLLQRSSGSDMGSSFGGSSQSLFGARGSGSFMGKLTAALATLFMLTSMTLAFYSSGKGRDTSIMQDAPQAQESPASPDAMPSLPPGTPAPNVTPQSAATPNPISPSPESENALPKVPKTSSTSP